MSSSLSWFVNWRMHNLAPTLAPTLAPSLSWFVNWRMPILAPTLAPNLTPSSSTRLKHIRRLRFKMHLKKVLNTPSSANPDIVVFFQKILARKQKKTRKKQEMEQDLPQNTKNGMHREQCHQPCDRGTYCLHSECHFKLRHGLQTEDAMSDTESVDLRAIEVYAVYVPNAVANSVMVCRSKIQCPNIQCQIQNRWILRRLNYTKQLQYQLQYAVHTHSHLLIYAQIPQVKNTTQKTAHLAVLSQRGVSLFADPHLWWTCSSVNRRNSKLHAEARLSLQGLCFRAARFVSRFIMFFIWPDVCDVKEHDGEIRPEDPIQSVPTSVSLEHVAGVKWHVTTIHCCGAYVFTVHEEGSAD